MEQHAEAAALLDRPISWHSERIGSLCSGIDGLGLGLEWAGIGEVVWQCEIDPHARQVLAHHWPGVPCYEDARGTDWTAVEPIDGLIAGYPCQPFSYAGKRKGADDPRHLWPAVAHALRVLRPRWAVLENVAGHLSLGFDAVLGDLAEAGFDATWACVRASDVGCPHRRERVFIVATDARGAGAGRDVGAVPRPSDQPRRSGGGIHSTRDAGQAPADADGGRLQERGEQDGQQGEPGFGAPRRRDAHRRHAAPADPDGLGPVRSGGARGRWARSEDGCVAVADPDESGLEGREPAPGRDVPAGSGEVAWGPYEPAIRRWEATWGPAPAPVLNGSLNPDFEEWMMGFPVGWTDVGIAATHRKRLIGNAVVPHVAALVGRELVSHFAGQRNPACMSQPDGPVA